MKKIKPYRYQRIGIKQLHRKFDGRAIVADEQGLGKTMQILWYARKYLRPSPVVVICPAHAKEIWRREAAKHVGIRAEILSSEKPPRHQPQNRKRLFVINYDILIYWLDWLLELNPTLVVADEAHYLKSMTALRTKAWIRLCQDAPHVIVATGTPIINDHADLFPLLHVLDPKRFPALMPFSMKYCRPYMYRGRWQHKGAKNHKKLNRILRKRYMIRRLKKNVMDDLPDKIISVVPLVLNTKQRKEYDEAERDLVRWLYKTSPQAAKRARRNERLAKFHYLSRLAVELTISARKRWLEDFHEESAGKIIVFGWHKSVLKDLHETFPKSVLITGDTPIKKRQQRTDKFNRDKTTINLFGNLQAAGTAWSCTSSSTVAFFETGWTAADHNQAIDRVHGIGRGIKGQKVLIYWHVAQDTIEEDKCKILQKKQRIADSTLDGKHKAIADNESIYDALERRLLKRRHK